MFRTLNAISPFLTCFPYHRSPSACLEGTHGDRVAGDNTQHSHRLLSFSFYVTRSRTKRIQTRPLTCTIRQARRSLGSPPCGSHPEYAHTVYKYALNKCSFIRLRQRRTHQADNLATIYIISFPGDVSTSLNMTIRCGGSHPCHSERKRGNPADRRTHQASTRTELRFEFLSISF